MQRRLFSYARYQTSSIVLFIISAIAPLYPTTSSRVVMLQPAGDAKNTGRILYHDYERTQAYKCARAIKHELEKHANLFAVLTREPGEEITALQSAQFANKIGADLVISIHMFKETCLPPKIMLYHLVCDPINDMIKRSYTPGQFIPLYQAHFQALPFSLHAAHDIKAALTNHAASGSCTCFGPLGLPCKELIGITQPAIIIEMGIDHDEGWSIFVQPIIQGILKNLGM